MGRTCLRPSISAYLLARVGGGTAFLARAFRFPPLNNPDGVELSPCCAAKTKSVIASASSALTNDMKVFWHVTCEVIDDAHRCAQALRCCMQRNVQASDRAVGWVGETTSMGHTLCASVHLVGGWVCLDG